jgi:hypothetical protein
MWLVRQGGSSNPKGGAGREGGRMLELRKHVLEEKQGLKIGDPVAAED